MRNRYLKVLGQSGFSAVVGCLTAVVVHYMLYRIGLPLKPFIYVVF
jgi:hypothetical protein